MLFKKDADKAIGKFVNANGVVYQVVGLFTDKGSFQPNAFIPFTTLQLIYNKGDKLNNLIFMTRGLDTEEKMKSLKRSTAKLSAYTTGLQLMTKALSGCGTVSLNSCNKKKVCAF